MGGPDGGDAATGAKLFKAKCATCHTAQRWVGLQTEEEELEAARQRSRGSGRPFGAVLMRGEGAESALEAAEDDGTLPRPGGVVAQPVSARVNLLAKKYLW